MGAGKSHLGSLLGESLGLPVIDLDRRIERASGFSITETILDKGELFFRKMEREQLLYALDEAQFVLCTGGGTPCYYDNIDLMNKHSLTIYLRYSVQELYERLEGHQSERPLIAHLEGESLKEYIAKHLFERSHFYEDATASIDAGGKSPEQILEEITKLVQ